GLAVQPLGPPRVLDPGELDQDPVLALLLDGRLGDAELVDAVPDRLERLAHGQVAELDDLARPEDQHDAARRLVGFLRLEDPDVGEDALGVLPLRGRGELDGQLGGAAALDARDGDALPLELAADGVAGAVDLGGQRLVHLDAQHEVDAALEIEAEVDGPLRRVEEPRRQGDDGHHDGDARTEAPAHQPPESFSPHAGTMRPRALRSKSTFTWSAIFSVMVCSLSPTTVPCRPLPVTTRSPFLTAPSITSRSFFCRCWGRISKK